MLTLLARHWLSDPQVMSRILLCFAVVALSFPVSFLVDRIVSDPYMDEIFHIPQMQQYCKGNFQSWDPMITTPPGLYMISYIYSLILHFGMGTSLWPDSCSPSVLRHVNVLFSVICAILIREISLHLEPQMDPILASLKALALSCHPLHWFFTFLFYTDVGSTTAVLATYFASLKRAYWISALMSLVAISFRQTNVVWTFFVLCVSILDFLYGECSGGAKLRLSVDKPLNQKLVRVGKKEYRTSGQVQGNGKKLFDIEDLLGEVLFILQHGWQKRVALMRQFFPFILPFLCFASFLVYNGSIVLGAKEAHKVSPHFTQLLYFSAFALLAMAPIHMDPFFIWTNLFSLFKFIHGWRGCFLIVLGGIVSCIHFFSFAHPYLVSDNRHYTFYMWRKIINVRWYSKYLLAIVYLYSWWSIFRLLGKKRNIWLMVFFGAVAAVLVPAPLIEFRYYTIPLYIIALHTPLTLQNGYLAWMLLLLQNMCVNAVTMYIFLYRPFVTHSWDGPQRFIW